MFRWLLKKIQLRLKSFNSRYNKKNYPSEIRKHVKNASISIKYDYKKIDNKKKINSKSIIPDRINIINNWIPFNKNKIDWEFSYQDPEYKESLHRWNWMVYSLSTNESNSDNWVIKIQEDWIVLFQNEIQSKKVKIDNLIHWESYTVSERIANSIILYECKSIIPTIKIQKALIEQVQFLINRLEYFGENTGNHILNNARAIYLAGIYFNCDDWLILAESITRRELPKLITEDGFLREGSSHYQFLFTRWILELLIFSKKTNNTQFINYLNLKSEVLLNKCNFFILNQKLGQINYPLFGDISPDFPPDWLAHLTYFQKTTNKTPLPNYCWNNLFLNNSNNDMLEMFTLEKFVNEENFCYPKSGWYRFNKNKYTLFLHSEPKDTLNHVGHSHNDTGHFSLFYNSLPIFVDTGRKNYSSLSGSYAESHNIITLNGLGVNPENRNRFPYDYVNSSHVISSSLNNNEFHVHFESNGFNRISKNIFWKRDFNFEIDKFHIIDNIIGNGEFMMKSYFHFDKSIIINQENLNTFSFDLDEKHGSFIINSNEEFEVKTYFGGDEIIGWQSLAYDKSIPIYTIEITKPIILPEQMNYSLILDII